MGQSQCEMLLAQPNSHRGTTLNRQLRSKLKQSCRYLSHSAPPGVSWPLGNFLLNYTACSHLWNIMTLSPSAPCCWDMKANLHKSNQSVGTIQQKDVWKKKIIQIRSSQLLKFHLMRKKKGCLVLKMSENIWTKLKNLFYFTLLSQVRLFICSPTSFFLIKGLYHLLH